MSPEEVARHHAERPGYELADWVEVTLPIYKVYVVASLLQYTPLPPIYEFVLRAVRLGVDDVDQLSACLGIPAGMVDATLRGLHASEEVAIRPGRESDVEQFVLTRKGEKTTTSLELVRPEQLTIPIYFDGLLRQPVEPPIQPMLSGRQAQDMGFREIPPFPASRVEVADIDLPTAARMLARARSGEGRKDLLAIKSIDRRMRLHMPVLALVFKQSDGDEVELLFANETRLLDEHNRAFERAQGAAKLHLLNSFTRSEQIGASSLARKIAKLATSPEKKSEPARRATIRVKPVVASEAIETLSMLDHAGVLRDALEKGQRRVVIISPWITAQVIDKRAIASVRALLDRGCRLFIGYGIDENRPTKPIPPELSKLAETHPNFDLLDFEGTHEKILIKDDEYIVVGSFNWLSYRGDANRKLRREISFKVNDAAFVEKQFAPIEARFRQAAARL